MGKVKYTLKGEVSTANPRGIKAVLVDVLGATAVTKTERGFLVKASMSGESARELNRSLLSALRRVEKKTTLRAEWTHAGVTEKFFDYVPKGIRKD